MPTKNVMSAWALSVCLSVMLCQVTTAAPITDLQVVLRGGPMQARMTVTDANDDDNNRNDPNGDINLRNRNLPGNQVKIPNLAINFCQGPDGFIGICMTTTAQGVNSFEALVADPVQIGLDITGKLNIAMYSEARIDLSGSASGAVNTRVTQIEWFASVNNNRVDDPNRPINQDRIRFDNFGPLPANMRQEFTDSVLDKNNAGVGPASILGVFDLDFGNSNNPMQTLRLPSSAFVGVIVPEPSSLTLLGLGTLGLLGYIWRRSKREVGGRGKAQRTPAHRHSSFGA